MTFAQAVQTTPVVARTTNGMTAVENTTDPVVDLFYKIGASRGKNVAPDFERAYQFDSTLATRILLWARDIRGGAGEREVFRDILLHLENLHPEMLERVLPHVVEFGRWDDLLIFKTKNFRDRAYALIKSALDQGNGLCAKWMPRKGDLAVELRNYLGFTPKQYRKTLVNLTSVVETKMCAKDWNNINFSHVPSVASARYQRAFGRNAPDAYAQYKASLTAGTAKVNAEAVYPHDVIKSISLGDKDVARAQWAALPNYMGDSAVLPMVDVSGSMNCSVGGNPNLTCMDVAVALGLYCADKNRGAFKDLFLTFTTSSKLEVLRGDIVSKCSQLRKADWGMSTNLHSAFEAVLNVAVNKSVPQEDMPKYILILSDMQFNRCVQNDDSAMQMIERKYAAAGYQVPNVVFWNLHDSGTVPVTAHHTGAALISGFSPSIMKSVLAAKQFTPRSVMLDTINQPRYCVI
jgi:hypothetical protein